jgi:valyl-tRNA synthetase
MPFITEELYHALSDKEESIMFAQIEKSEKQHDNQIIIDNFEKTKEIITNIRNIRASKNLSPKEKLTLLILGEHNAEYNDVIIKLANISLSSSSSSGRLGGAASFLVGTTEYAVPVGDLINIEEEIKKLETELYYQEGFLKSVTAKLSNEKFVANAKPEIVENERKKLSDAETKIATIKENIQHLKP